MSEQEDAPAKLDFSVIVPTRDRPDLLERALLHIKQQTHGDFEVLVVDDGSADETLACYERVWRGLDERFRLLLRAGTERRGSGPSATRNYGLRHARGRFITFCDDDDYWCDPEHLAIAAGAFAAVAEADLFIANQKGVNGAGEVTIRDWMSHVTPCLPARPTVGRDDVHLIARADLLQGGGQVGHLNTSVLRRGVIDAVTGFWEAVGYEEDREFLLRAMDGKAQLLYRSAVVAVHCVPDSAIRANASTRLNPLDKWLVRILTSQHVMVSATSPDVLHYARTLAGHAFRHVAVHFAEERRFADARRFAFSALAINAGWRWCLYSLYLAARSLFKGAREKAASWQGPSSARPAR
jgi:glycosyltransferase involved in cell wall biosynthesis